MNNVAVDFGDILKIAQAEGQTSDLFSLQSSAYD